MSAVAGWDDDMLDGMRLVGDPVADDVVSSIFAADDVASSRALLQELLRHDDPRNADVPAELHTYLNDTAALPEWVDADQIKHGELVFRRWGVPISVALFCASLPSAYACGKGVRVLAQTARLETDTRRRIMETGQFLIDVMGPGGLAPGGSGIMAIQRVRLMHASIRHLILAHQAAVSSGHPVPGPPPWDDAWGHPINQEDLAGTLLSFSYTVVEPLPRMGMRPNPDEIETYLYVWRAIGEMLGLDRSMIPTDEAESTELVALIRRRQYANSADGVAMTKALVGLLDEMTPIRRLDGVIPDLIRMLSGDEVAEILELPARTRHYGLLALLKVVSGIGSHEVENDKVLRGLVDHVGWYVLNGVFDVERQGEHRAEFDIPDQLADHWGLDVAPS